MSLARWCLAALIFLSALRAEVVEVKAQSFEGDGMSGKSVLKGGVSVKKGKDVLFANEMEIYTDPKRKLKNIRALGNVRFALTTQDGRRIEGSCDELDYNVQTGDYHLFKNAKVREKGKENALNGDEIFLNNKTGMMNVKGTQNKPAKLIFDLDKKEK